MQSPSHNDRRDNGNVVASAVNSVSENMADDDLLPHRDVNNAANDGQIIPDNVGLIPANNNNVPQNQLVNNAPVNALNNNLPENIGNNAQQNAGNHVQPIAQNGNDARNILANVGNNALNNQPAFAAREPIPPGNFPPMNFPPQPNMDDWRHLLRALVRNNVQLPEFSGQDHEDPENFIRECEDSFNAINTEMHTRARLASRALKDDAAKWFAVYKNLNLTWVKFCELLRNRYASPTTMMKLSAKVYGQPQTEKEGTGLFLEQRHLLARRLFPDAPEQQIVGILIESLRPSVKKLLRTSTFETVGDLALRAKQIEADELEERSAGRRNVQVPASADKTQPKSTAPSAAAAAQSKSLPRCHFCPGRHWNRDCPVNPINSQGQGNGSGATMNAAGAAPTNTH